MQSIVEKIKQAFELEQGHEVKVTRRTQVPANYQCITPEWLTDILCREVAGAKVLSHRLDTPDNGSSNRRRIFITYNDAGRKAALPASVFCKAAEGVENRIVLGVAGTALAEANFFNKVRPRISMNAPIAYHADFDPQTYAYIIVMKDIGGEVEFCDERTPVDWHRATQLVTTLAKLHSSFYESKELATPTLPFKRWPAWWTAMMTGAPRFGEFCDRAFGDAERVIPPRLFKRRAEIWPCTMQSAARHSQLPETLIHSDVHFKNWYIMRDQQMGLSDWQLATIGHWSRDYVFATTTALTVENRRAWDKELLRYYLDRMAEYGVPQVSLDEAQLNIRQQLFSALAFWTITLRPADDMPAMQPEHTTYEFIRRMATAIDDLDAVDSFS
jgi:hypothetical protein